MRAIGIIPARYASTRFPGKPLAMIAGKTMIRRVAERALQATMLESVLVATDDSRIAEECERHDIPYCYTAEHHSSGTDRIWEAFSSQSQNSCGEFDAVINIQGDEPLIEPGVIDLLIRTLQEHGEIGVATAVSRISTPEDLQSSSIVKVALNNRNEAMYFSRSIIPHYRDKSPAVALAEYAYVRHIGIYAYRTWALQKFVQLPPHPLELLESLEQLRLLSAGVIYKCAFTDTVYPAVDIPTDIALVERYL